MNINKMFLCVVLALFSQTAFGMDQHKKQAVIAEIDCQADTIKGVRFFEQSQTSENLVTYNGKFEIVYCDRDHQPCHALRIENAIVQELNYFLYQKMDSQTALSFCARQYSIRRQQQMLEGNDANKLGISFVNPLFGGKRILVYPDYHNVICFLDDVRAQSLE
jgi:hypothetical protein